MGDLPLGSRPQASSSTPTGPAQDDEQHPASSSPLLFTNPDISAPFYSQYSSINRSHHRPDTAASTHPTQYTHKQEYINNPLNMGAMAGALPEVSSFEDSTGNPQGRQPTPRSLSGASTPALAYQSGHNLQILGHSVAGMTAHPTYTPSFVQGGYQQTFVSPQGSQYGSYPPYASSPSRHSPASLLQAPYQNYPQVSPYLYYAPSYGPQMQYNPQYHTQSTSSQQMYGRPLHPSEVSMGGRQGMQMSQLDGTFLSARGMPEGAYRESVSTNPGYAGSFAQSFASPSSGPMSSIPRGPPRKPKQSGHALWVGNLPPGTTVIPLKDHFSREATTDIESLFLISKSNCAFVNYRTEASCTAAMHRFHDSRFNGVRLVCRLRRSSTAASGVPTGPSAMVGGPTSSVIDPTPLEIDGEPAESGTDGKPQPPSPQIADATSSSQNKYFIVKSLTQQDLELSVRNGIWATQSHNEEALNKAFRTTDNVYLIFSANKSGEYFGYARMVSPIREDSSQLIGAVSTAESTLDATDVPKSIPTPATTWAPKGRIIDDSARGTIFWEADVSDSESEDESADKEEVQADGDTLPVAQSWGKPFKIEWISTKRLPFYRTRGLRNPWNANREIKIARDGTELEPSIGERLIHMFHRLDPSGAPPRVQQQQQQQQPGSAQMRLF